DAVASGVGEAERRDAALGDVARAIKSKRPSRRESAKYASRASRTVARLMRRIAEPANWASQSCAASCRGPWPQVSDPATHQPPLPRMFAIDVSETIHQAPLEWNRVRCSGASSDSARPINEIAPVPQTPPSNN